MTNPHAKAYAFPEGSHPALSDYLNENTQYDPETGCLEWTASVDGKGIVRPNRATSSKYGTAQVPRLSWLAHYGRKIDRKTHLTRSCGNPKCIHPLHLRETSPEDKWAGPDIPEHLRAITPPHRPRGSIGELKLGKRRFTAQRVYQIQSYPRPRDPSLGLPAMFLAPIWNPRLRWSDLRSRQLRELAYIRAIRRCPIRATRTELPSGFIRYDLPPGLTEIAFTEPQLVYEPLPFDDDDDGPESHWVDAA
jgi:hypothetical protein